MSYSNEDKERDLKILDFVEKRYNFELQRLRDLDTKASNLIGYVSVITTLILGIGAFGFLSNLSEKSYSIIYFVGIFALVSSITVSLVSMMARRYEFRPTFDDIQGFFLSSKTTSVNVIRETIDEMNNASLQNFKINNQKGICLLIGNLLLIVGIIFLLSYAIVFTYEKFNSSIMSILWN
jgi:uncharacterized membrane protein HdeD (DUF308 family)